MLFQIKRDIQEVCSLNLAREDEILDHDQLNDVCKKYVTLKFNSSFFFFFGKNLSA